jgi:small GTP-binding protein
MPAPTAAVEGTPVYKGKVVVVGDYSCGKTSLVQRYGSGQYMGIQEPTIAAAFQSKVVDLSTKPECVQSVTWAAEPGVVGRSFSGGTAAGSGAGPNARSGDRAVGDGPVHATRRCTVKLEIWDTAGSERYQSLMPMYFRDAVAALVVFDVTRRSTFKNVSRWLEAYLQHNERQNRGMMRPILVACKSDVYSSIPVGDPSKDRLGGPEHTPHFGHSTLIGTTPLMRSPDPRRGSTPKSPTGFPDPSSAGLIGPASVGISTAPEVSVSEVLTLGAQLGLPVCFTSAKADWNVSLLFRDVAIHVAEVSEKLGPRNSFGLRNGRRGDARLAGAAASFGDDGDDLGPPNGATKKKCCD